MNGAPPGPARRPTVSVVVPVRDDAAHLQACLALLRMQSRPVDEVVVVDNGSRDRSAEVARAAGARVVVQPRPGIPAAAATGYDAARGELILRCDADSRPGPDWVERVCAVLESAPQAAGVTGPPRFLDRVGVGRRVAQALHTFGYRWCAGAAVAAVPLWGSNFGLRAEAWRDVRDRVERVDPLVHDDLDLSFCLALTGRYRVVHDPALRMGASGRGFVSPAARHRQLRMAVATLRRNWAVLSPGKRWVWRLGGPLKTLPEQSPHGTPAAPHR